MVESEKRTRYNTRYRIKNPEKYMLSRAKSRAKKAGLQFDLTIEDIIIPDYCPILEIKLNKSGGKLGKSTPSLDRIDNSKGYIKGNVKVISWHANTMKGRMTREDISRLYKYVSQT